MASPRPTTIAGYIEAAPTEGRPHLRKLHEILRQAAPKAEGVIKWNTPFFVEPRFLFSFSANKAHASFAPPLPVLEEFRAELHAQKFKTTQGTIQLPYAQPLPEALIRRIARRSLEQVSARESDTFW